VADLGYDATLAAFGASLDELGLDYLDLYLIHWPAPAIGLYLESWRALEHVLASGKVRSIGVSNFLPEHLQKVIDLGGTVPAVNQIELHPALQQRDIAEFNAANGIATEAGSPLAQGAVLADPAVTGIAAKKGVSPAQAILRWHLQQGRIIIPKFVTPRRIKENLEVFGFDLTADELSVIDGLERDGRTGPHPAEFNG
jgi:2,5-diketo-D-gluconate reductase A